MATKHASTARPAGPGQWVAVCKSCGLLTVPSKPQKSEAKRVARSHERSLWLLTRS